MLEYRIEKIEAVRCHYILGEGNEEADKPQFGIATIISKMGDNLNAKMQVKTLGKAKGAFLLDIVVSGDFSVRDCGDSPKDVKDLKRLAVTILYPYLRSYVTGVTSLLSNKKGVTLGIIDVEKVANEAEF
ncbi:MAG: hypothetical protein K6B51_04435, partial [Bacilli bacterium]|nr:hypothetical protein [Bacilli bacterium]